VSGDVSEGRENRESARAWRKWAFAAVPVVGLLELGAHVVQTRSVVSGKDWDAARDYVSARITPADLVAFAPRWTEPLALEHFGPGIATFDRVGRQDETRFPRAFEVSIRGAHLPAFQGWRRVSEEQLGGVTVTTWENPAPATVVDDLVTMITPQAMRASRVDAGRETECSFVHGSPQTGGLGFGPAIPGDRFACPGGGFVGVSVVADLEYNPRRCVFAPPQRTGALRLRFAAVRFGRAVHGHHGLDAEAERHRQGAPVTLSFKQGDSVLGSVVHRDGEGWKPFEFDTTDLAGQTAELTVEISSPGGEGRLYCFEAETR
jgi:hypothetical protein